MRPDFDTIVVPSCGGGLNFAQHPAELRPDEWSWGDGWVAKDGYAEVLPAYELIRPAGFVSESAVPQALLQSPFGWQGVGRRPFVLPMVNGTNGNVRLFLLSSNGGFDEILWNGGGVQPTGDPNDTLVVHGAFLNGVLVMNFGVGAGSVSMIRWGGGTQFQSMAGDAPRCYYLASFAGQLIAAVTGIGQVGIRSLAISDVNDPTVWTPAANNVADAATLDDLRSAINGLAIVGDNLAIFTRGALYQLTATGAFPPFTRHVLQRRGCLDRFSGAVDDFFPMGPMLGETPRGTIFRGADDFYVAETGQGVGRKIYDYWRWRDDTTDMTPMPCFSFHEQRGVLYVPVAQPVSGDAEILLFDPVTGAWSRRTFPAGTFPYRHACLWDWPASAVKPVVRHLFVEFTQAVYAERTDGAPQSGAYFDTKDFRLPDPFLRSLHARIKVDWEPLTNAATDAIEILAARRDDFAPGFLGSDGKHLDLSAQMVSQGTLTGGQSELPLRGQGKFLRLRFKQASGRVRIRGFALYANAAGSDRRGA